MTAELGGNDFAAALRAAGEEYAEQIRARGKGPDTGQLFAEYIEGRLADKSDAWFWGET